MESIQCFAFIFCVSTPCLLFLKIKLQVTNQFQYNIATSKPIIYWGFIFVQMVKESLPNLGITLGIRGSKSCFSPMSVGSRQQDASCFSQFDILKKQFQSQIHSLSCIIKIPRAGSSCTTIILYFTFSKMFGNAFSFCYQV